jgi:hypothetical protein
MARLLTFPNNPGVVSITPISGPAARSSGSTTAQDGSEQTFDGYGDVVALELKFNAKMDVSARRERGLFAAFQGGANAARLRFYDPDIMRPYEAGMAVPHNLRFRDLAQVNWSNGQPWSNGQGWMPSAPIVPVAAASSYDSGIVTLDDVFWGHGLGLGDYIGFFPFHFGIYAVTEVISEGQYRVWPRLRAALTTSSYATLFPTIVMRPISRDSIRQSRGLSTTDGSSISLVEVIDPYVRKYFIG